MMKKNIFAIVDFGSYEGYTIEFIELNENDKEKFIQYCRQAEAIGGDDDISITLRGWARDVKAGIDRTDLFELNILTIHEHQQRIKESVERIDNMKERNYLYPKRDMVADLLKYEFAEV